MLARLDTRSRAAARGLERSRDPEPVHHSDDRVPDHLQRLSADLLARLLVHRLPRLGERAGALHRPAELSRAPERPERLAELHRHGEVRDRLGDRAGAGRLRPRHAAQPHLPDEGLRHHAAAPADDDVDGGGGAVLEAALRPVLGTDQLRARPRQVRVAVEPERRALRGRDHRHLDVGAVRDAAVARRALGGAEAPLRGGGDRPGRAAGTRFTPHHAAAGGADPADRDHLPHHGGVQDLRPRLHHVGPADHRDDLDPALQDGVPGVADRASPARSPTSC